MKQTKDLAPLMKYKNEKVVKKYAQEQKVSIETAQEHFEECKKFLYVAAISFDSVSPSKILDEMWHTFILFTRDYTDFCYTHFGKFIHHEPGTGSDKSQEFYLQAFNYAKMLAGITFENISEDVWTTKSKKQIAGHCDTGQCACGDDCSDCTSCGCAL